MYDREVRSGNWFASEGTKQGEEQPPDGHPFLALLDPLLMNFRAQVSHHHPPCRAKHFHFIIHTF